MFYYSEMEPAELIMRPRQPDYSVKARKFQGIASMECTCGGRLLACFYGGKLEEKKGNYVIVTRSDDDGESWVDPYLVVVHPDPEMRLFDPNVWIDPVGRLWLTWSQSYTYFDGRHGVWAAICDNPDEAELVFHTPRRIANGVMMCKPTVLRDNTWLFPCAVWIAVKPSEEHEEVTAERLSNVYASTDAGRTIVRRGGANVPNRCFDEHMVVERRDGSLWMLVRRFDGIGESFSYDGGYTWWQEKSSALKGPNSRFFIRRLKSGNLLMVNHQDFTGRNNLTATLSFDDGRTWHGGLLLDGRDNVSYPDGAQGEDGRIYIAYDHERLKEREILMAVFTERDILAGTPTGVHTRLGCIISRAAD